MIFGAIDSHACRQVKCVQFSEDVGLMFVISLKNRIEYECD